MRPLAIFTIVQNETVNLEAWLINALRHVGPEDIYILDHQTTGDAADAMIELYQSRGVMNVLPLTHEHSYDSNWLTLTTRYFQQFLLASYKTVLFSAADEIVTPLSGTLVDYAQNNAWENPVIIPQAFNVIHKKDEEPPLDWGKPVMLQRKYCHPNKAYCKPLLARSPTYWYQAWRGASNVKVSQSAAQDLVLLHLHRADYDTCLRAHRERNARTWLPEERREGNFRHNMVEDAEMLYRWMLSDEDNQSQYAKLIETPKILKELC